MAREVPDLDLWDDARAERRRRRGHPARARSPRRRRASSTRASRTPTARSSGAAWARRRSRPRRASRARTAARTRRCTWSRSATTPSGKKRNGSYWTSSRFAARCSTPEAVGLEAARRTVAKLGSRKIATCEVPVVFSPDAARGLLGQFAGVMSGGAVWRKSTYLAEREGTPVASALRRDRRRSAAAPRAGLAPLRRRGPGEPHQRARLGRHAAHVPVRRLRGAQARAALDRLGGARASAAARTSATSNLILRAGQDAGAELEKLDRGLYVTELMGFGFNAVTGDYSQGAAASGSSAASAPSR